jgi:hypothetical protein
VSFVKEKPFEQEKKESQLKCRVSVPSVALLFKPPQKLTCGFEIDEAFLRVNTNQSNTGFLADVQARVASDDSSFGRNGQQPRKMSLWAKLR